MDAFNRRPLVADINYDGVVTVSDAALWIKWFFFLPGDAVVWFIISYAPGIATFFELPPQDYGGSVSGTVSLLSWLFVPWLLLSLLGKMRNVFFRSSVSESEEDEVRRRKEGYPDPTAKRDHE